MQLFSESGKFRCTCPQSRCSSTWNIPGHLKTYICTRNLVCFIRQCKSSLSSRDFCISRLYLPSLLHQISYSSINITTVSTVSLFIDLRRPRSRISIYTTTSWSRAFLEKLLLWKPKDHYRTWNSPSSVPVQHQISPGYALHPTSWRPILILSPCLGPRPSKWSLSLRFPHQNPVRTSLSHTYYIPRPSHSSWFDHPNNIWCGVQATQLLIMHSSPLNFVTFVPLRSKHSKILQGTWAQRKPVFSGQLLQFRVSKVHVLSEIRKQRKKIRLPAVPLYAGFTYLPQYSIVEHPQPMSLP
jgi:hypothetical protein